MTVTVVAFLMALLVGCGGSDGGTPSTGTDNVGANNGCPQGEYYATNGDRDFIQVGNDGSFHMERVSSSASGYITCVDSQTFYLTIEASVGNCDEAANCLGMNGVHGPEDIYYNVQGPGTYTCRFSVANYTFNVRCTGSAASEGNYFYTSKAYYLPGYR